MLTSLQLFLRGIAQRWWFWAVSVPSGILTIVDLYAPDSSGFLSSFRGTIPAAATVIFAIAFFAAGFQTYHQLRIATSKSYDPTVGERLHRLYQRGSDLARGALHFGAEPPDPQDWVDQVERLLQEHLPGELRMFQVAGDAQRADRLPRRLGRVRHVYELRPKLEKFQEIMGRYEARQ